MNWKIFRTLFFAIFASMLGQGLVVPLLPAYAHNLGASGLYIGFIFGAFSLSTTLFLPYFGQLSDVRGRKPLIISGLFAYFITSVAFMFSANISSLIMIRFLQGIAAAAIMPVVRAYAGDITPKGKEGLVMGMLNVFLWAGLGAGPIIGGVMKDSFGINAAFLSMGLVCLAGFFGCVIFLPPVKSEHISARGKHPVSLWKLVSDKYVSGLFIFRLVHSMCLGAVWTFGPLLADVRFGLSGLVIGSMLTSGLIVGAVLMAPMGILADRMSKKLLIVIGGLIVVYGMFFFADIQKPWEFFAVSILLSAGGAIAIPSIMAMTVIIGSRKGSMGSIMSLLTLAESLGTLIGPILAGVVVDMLGMTVAFSGGAILMLLAIILNILCNSK